MRAAVCAASITALPAFGASGSITGLAKPSSSSEEIITVPLESSAELSKLAAENSPFVRARRLAMELEGPAVDGEAQAQGAAPQQTKACHGFSVVYKSENLPNWLTKTVNWIGATGTMTPGFSINWQGWSGEIRASGTYCPSDFSWAGSANAQLKYKHEWVNFSPTSNWLRFTGADGQLYRCRAALDIKVESTVAPVVAVDVSSRGWGSSKNHYDTLNFSGGVTGDFLGIKAKLIGLQCQKYIPVGGPRPGGIPWLDLSLYVTGDGQAQVMDGEDVINLEIGVLGGATFTGTVSYSAVKSRGYTDMGNSETLKFGGHVGGKAGAYVKFKMPKQKEFMAEFTWTLVSKVGGATFDMPAAVVRTDKITRAELAKRPGGGGDGN